jgi:hypothetical protein
MKKVILLSLIIIIIGSLFTGCGMPNDNISKEEQKRELISISNSTQISGNFFLGSGSINEQPVFYYYYKTQNSSIKLSYALAGLSEIFTDIKVGEKPYVIYKPVGWSTYESWKFHIPIDSIISTFELDVRNIK